MLETFIQIDTQILLAINGHYSNFLDIFMYQVSKTTPWIPWYILILILCYKKYHKETIWILLTLVVFVFLSDRGTVLLFKDVFQRLRPSHQVQLEGLLHFVRNYRGGDYGFISSHASNTFGIALLSSLFLQNKIFTFFAFLWVALVSYSRMYLGVHYPSDIFCGWLFGGLLAYILFFIFKKIAEKKKVVRYLFHK